MSKVERIAIDANAHRIARECKGFLDDSEGLRLFELARQYAHLGPVVEIGSYCGKSAVYLGAGVKAAGGTLICIDHHRGSEEQQKGEEYYDDELYDTETGQIDSLVFLRRTIRQAGLENTAVLLVTNSSTAAELWCLPVGMVFIDGGHSREAVLADYYGWAPKVASGGILAIHDLFPDPAQGGQAPIEIYRQALATGLFEELSTTKTLGVLRRRV
ncbi:MAG: class I SAM-dependent methyltransferase [Deltaproteobacteria bacterium]|nr:class I SAM-dependent methyltransferase [Deltaproteobacteria bacterium]